MTNMKNYGHTLNHRHIWTCSIVLCKKLKAGCRQTSFSKTLVYKHKKHHLYNTYSWSYHAFLFNNKV